MKISSDQLQNNLNNNLEIKQNQIQQKQNEFKEQLKNKLKKEEPEVETETTASEATAKAQDNNELKEAAQEMEALFVQQMLDEMREAGFESDLFGDGMGRDYFEDMFYKEVAKMTAQENSLGLAEEIYEQLQQK